jgi:hypothetical protein
MADYFLGRSVLKFSFYFIFLMIGAPILNGNGADQPFSLEDWDGGDQSTSIVRISSEDSETSFSKEADTSPSMIIPTSLGSLKQNAESVITNTERDNSLPQDFDPRSLSSLQAMTPAQKIGCCFLACLPCICVVGCFNNLTSLIDRATCGFFYQCCPCLDCDT